jgi:3-phosphoshikimate 1-carboxyvinyltransferase
VQPLLDGLNQLGAFAASSRGDGGAPVIIKGPFNRDRAVIDGADSQPVSGLLIASAFAQYPIDIEVVNFGERPWVDLTLSWFRKVGIPYSRCGLKFRLNGPNRIEAFTDRIPGDWSSAAFPIAAALTTGSTITLQNVELTDVQGDRALISILQKMGARFHIDRQMRSLTVEKSSLRGMPIDANDLIDAVPVLAVIGCFAKGRTEIVNAAIARKKESDRIASIACELRKMGATIEEKEDGLVVYESALQGAELHSHHDHRVAMSLSVAALAVHSPSLIRHVECSEKSYPAFYRDLQKLGAKIRL